MVAVLKTTKVIAGYLLDRGTPAKVRDLGNNLVEIAFLVHDGYAVSMSLTVEDFMSFFDLKPETWDACSGTLIPGLAPQGSAGDTNMPISPDMRLRNPVRRCACTGAVPCWMRGEGCEWL